MCSHSILPAVMLAALLGATACDKDTEASATALGAITPCTKFVALGGTDDTSH